MQFVWTCNQTWNNLPHSETHGVHMYAYNYCISNFTYYPMKVIKKIVGNIIVIKSKF